MRLVISNPYHINFLCDFLYFFKINCSWGCLISYCWTNVALTLIKCGLRSVRKTAVSFSGFVVLVAIQGVFLFFVVAFFIVS